MEGEGGTLETPPEKEMCHCFGGYRTITIKSKVMLYATFVYFGKLNI